MKNNLADCKTDRQIIEEILLGKTESFENLFEKYYSQALRTAFLITNNKCDSEYVVQDSFVKCYEKLNKLKKPDSFKYWFFRILTRTSQDYCNKRKKEYPSQDILQQNQAITSSSVQKSSLEILAEKETSKELMSAVRSLKTKHRTVIVLYYYQEFSISEIAQILKISEGTVKSRLFHARKILEKSLLQKMNGGEQNG